MHEVEAVLFMLMLVAALAWVATRVGIAYPILLVVGGLLIGGASTVLPHVPHVALNPDLVFVLFLPPLLYYGGLMTSWRDFRANIRPITLLAVGLVLFTTVCVAAVARWLIPGFESSWAAAFALGAIISPPDAIAASAVAQRLRIPKRIVTILEGESAVNDATALVAYRFAVAAAASTVAFSPAMAGLQ
ncbi:MAG TPA: cation:proton antiporter, partial [Tepidisphaeraceae bacterium]|nr:cation:proton antiporter [Tepidisphaeraceae bacterium]